jgi:hypothetical protein
VRRYCDIAAKTGLLELQDLRTWVDRQRRNAPARPLPSVVSFRGDVEAIAKEVSPRVVVPRRRPDGDDGDIDDGDGDSVIVDEDDDETDVLVVAAPPPPRSPPPVRTSHSHHVVYGQSKPVAVAEGDADLKGQMSVSEDWFTSLGTGEPPFTMVTPTKTACTDFLWFTPVSRNIVLVVRCSAAQCSAGYALQSLCGGVRCCCMLHSVVSSAVVMMALRAHSCVQGALVLSGLMSLPPRSHIADLLPTKELSSTHVAIMAEFRFEPACLTSDWCL